MAKKTVKNISRKRLGKLFHQGVLVLAICTFIWSTLNNAEILMSLYRTIIVYLIGSILVFLIEIILLRAQQWSIAEANRLKKEAAEAAALEAAKLAEEQEKLDQENGNNFEDPAETIETGAEV
jgi:hypothetical protein